MPIRQLREQRVAQAFAEFAALAGGDGDEDALQAVLAQRCVELLGVAGAAVALSDEADGSLPAAPAGADAGEPGRTMLMHARGRQIGILTLTGGAAGHLDDEMMQVGQALADAAGSAVLVLRERLRNELLTSQLQHALTSRVVIEQAVGILAERWRVDVQQAFDLLRGYARSHNLRLRQVAAAVVSRDVDPFPTHQQEPTSQPR